MGGANQKTVLLSEYNIQQSNNSSLILCSKQNQKEKYIMKTYVTTSREQHLQKLAFFSKYKENMQTNLQILKLVRILQEKQESLCSTSYKLHLIFQYSHLSIGKEINQRRNRNSYSLHNKNNNSVKYFSYIDICNILYSCLSCLWLTKEHSLQEHKDTDLQRFRTMFISTQNILLFGEGIIKIMDPFITDYGNRYTFDKNVYYSPQKITNFYIIDDQKCAIFQLGMTILSISLLQPLSCAYQQGGIIEEIVYKKLQKARQIYYNDLQNNDANVFDLIARMIQWDRQERFSLQQAIQCAQKMYETQQSFCQDNRQSLDAKFYTNQKKTLNNTAHSSNKDKESAKISARKYMKSPDISRFTINEVSSQKQQQSYAQSLIIGNIFKGQQMNSSLLQDGIFQGLNLGADSYSYCSKYNILFPTANYYQNKMNEQNIFTDPQFLRSINRSLQKIESRKRQKTHDVLLASSILGRQSRYSCNQRQIFNPRFTNKVYLQQQQ